MCPHTHEAQPHTALAHAGSLRLLDNSKVGASPLQEETQRHLSLILCCPVLAPFTFTKMGVKATSCPFDIPREASEL